MSYPSNIKGFYPVSPSRGEAILGVGDPPLTRALCAIEQRSSTADAAGDHEFSIEGLTSVKLIVLWTCTSVKFTVMLDDVGRWASG